MIENELVLTENDLVNCQEFTNDLIEHFGNMLLELAERKKCFNLYEKYETLVVKFKDERLLEYTLLDSGKYNLMVYLELLLKINRIDVYDSRCDMVSICTLIKSPKEIKGRIKTAKVHISVKHVIQVHLHYLISNQSFLERCDYIWFLLNCYLDIHFRESLHIGYVKEMKLNYNSIYIQEHYIWIKSNIDRIENANLYVNMIEKVDLRLLRDLGVVLFDKGIRCMVVNCILVNSYVIEFTELKSFDDWVVKQIGLRKE